MTKTRAKGNAYENSLMPWLRRWYVTVRRTGLPGTRAGSNGLGDFTLGAETRYVLEAKCQHRLDLAAWHKQASADALTASRAWSVPHVAAVVIHKRHGTTEPGEQWVTMSAADFMWLVNGEPGEARCPLVKNDPGLASA